MTPVHEIAFLVLSGALSCWTWPAENNPCPNADSLKIPAYEKPDLRKKPLKFIDRNSFKSFLTAEVGYEENGFAVFETKNSDWYQIMNESGEKLWLNLPSVEKQFQSHLSTSDKASHSASWRLEKIEKLVGQGMARVEPDYLKYLRNEDLKSQVQIPKQILVHIHERQLKSRLNETKTELPTSFVEVSLPCTYREISPGHKTGSCTPPPKIAAYEKPDLNAPNTKIAMSWANWAGKPIVTPNQERTLEHLYIFSDSSDWLNIQVAFGDSAKRSRWVKKSDIGQFKIQNLPYDERVAALIHILESTNRPDDAAKIKELSPEPGFRATGRTKWSSDGVLWGEINIQDFPACSVEEPKTLMKAWLPYKLNRKSPSILSWYSRGC
ncbi:MAG: hypothetical protein AB7N80_04925 [Bdellovibrionales bacterium]